MAKPVIEFRPYRSVQGTKATFFVGLHQIRANEDVTLEFHEVKFEKERKTDDKILGTMKGKAQPVKGSKSPRFTIVPTGKVDGAVEMKDGDDKEKNHHRVAFVMQKPGGGTRVVAFDIPVEPIDQNDRETWFFQVKLTSPQEVISVRFPIAEIPWMLAVPKEATYDWHAHNEVHFYHGGSEGPPGSPGSLIDISNAIRNAKSFVFVADWSFHPYFRMDRGPGGAAGTAGRLLLDAANRGVLVAIHAWKHASQAADEQNNRMGARLEEIAGGSLPATMHWRVSERTGMRWSHHQKMVVCDVEGPDGKREVKAFFGGVDLTRGRFDWSSHIIAPGDPLAGDYMKKIKRSRRLNDKKSFPAEYHDWYNGEFQNNEDEESGGSGDVTMPREPWHDIHGWILGPGAWDVMREFVGRWNNDPNGNAEGTGWKEEWVDGGYESGGANVRTFQPADVDDINKKFVSLFDVTKGDDKGFKYVQQNEQPKSIDDRPWCAQVYRSLEKQHWDKGSRLSKEVKVGGRVEFDWKHPSGFERSIQDAYLRAIARAQNFVYIESQYFLSSGGFWEDDSRSSIGNQIAKALCDRIQQKKGDDFHVYIVTPMYPEGDPVAGAGQAIRNLEWRSYAYMIRRLSKFCDWTKHLSFYFPGRAQAPRHNGQLISAKDFKWVTGTKGGQKQAWLQDMRAPDAQQKIEALDKEGIIGFRHHGDANPPDRKTLVRTNNRYYVYVHSKMMIVDDLWIIFGSANLNERSLAGDRDSEICVGMWPAYVGVKEKCKQQIKTFREHLFQEHFGAAGSGDPKSIHGAVREAAKANYVAYRRGMPLPNGQCMLLPAFWDGSGVKIEPLPGVAEWSNDYLPDAAKEEKNWTWESDDKFIFNRAYLGPIVE